MSTTRRRNASTGIQKLNMHHRKHIKGFLPQILVDKEQYQFHQVLLDQPIFWHLNRNKNKDTFSEKNFE
jgi:hypothetical protein